MASSDSGSRQNGPATPDGSKVTINDVARIANVSKKTVSRVINESPMVREETRARVKDVIEQLNFTPDARARAIAFQKSFLIGMIYDNPSPQYVVNMQRGILDTLSDTSFQLVLRPCDRNDPRIYDQIRTFVGQQKPFGVILPPSVSEDDEVAAILNDHDCDYVRIASVALDTPSRMVRSHDADGSAQAARHLTGLGHRKIAHIHGPRQFRSAHERLAGFRSGLEEAGVTLTDAMTLEGAYTFDSGVSCAEKLLYGRDRPTAIFAGNDEMAMGVYQAARKSGLRIPEDLSIVGFDDTPMAARMWPPMSTVRLPIREMGRAAASLLMIGREARQKISEARSFDSEIVVRESTAPPK